jgi:pilus assembly protein TadC
MVQNFYRKIGSLFFVSYRNKYKQMIDLLERNYVVEVKLGKCIVYLFILYIINLFVFYYYFENYFVLSSILGIVTIFSFFIVDYLLIYFAVEDRKERIEKVMPDFLHLVSSNMRAGYTPFQALKSSARDEFGPLKREIEIATTKSLGTKSFNNSLLELSKRINSKLVSRIVLLFITSMKAGSHMADLMEETAKDISETKGLKNALATGTKTYTMFILFTVIIGAPMLYSVSLHFVDIMEGMGNKQQSNNEDVFELGLMSGGIDISSSFIFWMSFFMIVATSVFSAILIGVISEGNKTYGLRYAPFIALASLIIFFIARFLISNMF